LSPDEIRDGWRLACALAVDTAVSIEVPRQVRADAPKDFGPAVAPGPDRVPVLGPLLSGLPAPIGLAVDIGTTSLAAALVDLGTGATAVAGSMLNPQAEFGADVMSRIHAAGQDEAGRRPLTAAVRRGITALTNALISRAGASASQVAAAVVVGNPAMLHFWLAEDPWGLGVAPYAGRWTDAREVLARDVDLPAASTANVYVFPCVKSHVGADAVAAAVGVDLDRSDRPAMLIDLGTNTEIVLANGSRVFAASTAAGPAFECGGISCGMRAADGAIDALHIEPDGHWSAHVIGNVPPQGVCGSGLLDAVAELLRIGVIEPSGYMRDARQVEGLVPEALIGRLAGPGARRRALIVAPAGGRRGIALDAADVRQLQLAVGAVRAGIEVLCAEAGIAAADLQSVLVAGTFGQYVRKASLLRLGLLPPVAPERVHTVGNAAGSGAILALLDRRVRERAERLAGRTIYVELAGRADYQESLTRSLRFPTPGGDLS
jgi:uncharacterized 2Fe-2S/4Fe-4S cluster protein (DUF4445 family)